jgi:ribosomal protein S1
LCVFRSLAAGHLVCPGDVVQVYLEHAETPEGDMLVSGQQAAVKKRVSAVWHELEQAMRSGKPVKGRVLNSITGGYAVGVGGLVCFVANACITPGVARRIGELREYRVVKMVPERNNVVLEDYRYSVQNQTRAMQRHQAALARKKDINIGGGGISR